MRIRTAMPRTGLARVALGTLAGLALAFTASPAWAGQLNLDVKTTLTTITSTDTGTFTNTNINTTLDTMAGTVLQTQFDTILDTSISTGTGTFGNTLLNTLTRTIDGPSTDSTFLQTVTATDSGSFANTSLQTLTETLTSTLTATGLNTVIQTLVSTDTGSIANTNITTILETVEFFGQPADVSIEISQDGLNLTSPFNNQLRATALLNRVAVQGTRGISQINAQTGNANVSVASNSLIDGASLVSFAGGMSSQVALKELGVLALVPGFALQNSTKATTAHIAGLALAAAESTAVLGSSRDLVLTDSTTSGGDTTVDEQVGADTDVLSVTVAVDIIHHDINEYSPHDNITTVASIVSNDVTVRGTSGISQITAQSGSANTAGSHNLLLIDGSFGANGTAFNFNGP